ncbi:MAG: hypothetical protein IKR35_07275, partial [Lachnospiraceae bacterium]|nr:hypothetical protein [Lachnospiraceae bacterium]
EEMYLDKSPEYWSGWAIAFYQWYSGKSFERIFEYISIEELLNMYPVFHEMDIMQFVDEIDKKIASRSTGTRLSIIRKYAGITQKELSEILDVLLILQLNCYLLLKILQYCYFRCKIAIRGEALCNIPGYKNYKKRRKN